MPKIALCKSNDGPNGAKYSSIHILQLTNSAEGEKFSEESRKDVINEKQDQRSQKVTNKREHRVKEKYVSKFETSLIQGVPSLDIKLH